jgi:hypothetical protein
MEPLAIQIATLKEILPLLKETVSELNLFRYYPMQYDSKYSLPNDKVNPHDKVMMNDVKIIDMVITPIFKELGIFDFIWSGFNPYKVKSNSFMEGFVTLYMKLNFLLDPDNFPDLPEDK